MAVGLAPITATFGLIVATSGYRGAAAMGAGLLILYGYGFGYLLALLLAFPASIWSYWLYKTTGRHSRWASGLRAAVILVMLTPLVMFAVLAAVIVSR
ncbi:hypothetical protein D3872_03000 [Massilia cavernae]|uniref:Uncharacterized protein n=2 Tax=Massilia cavernae TaxID=2320864 RepID=A0A418Y723_9BURK|nr:hypothetical protein D3872_03000 [Massilia cavernae]